MVRKKCQKKQKNKKKITILEKYITRGKMDLTVYKL